MLCVKPSNGRVANRDNGPNMDTLEVNKWKTGEEFEYIV